jgi:TonB family protein
MLHPFVSVGRPARRLTRPLLVSAVVHVALFSLLFQQRSEVHGVVPRALGETVRYVRLAYPRDSRALGVSGHRAARRSAYVVPSGLPAPILASFELPQTASFEVVDPSAIIDSLMAQVARAGVGEVLASLENASPIGHPRPTNSETATSDTGAVAMAMNPKPIYPASMIGRSQEAAFLVYFVVDSTGRVDTSTIAVPSSVPTAFATSVRQVLAKWMFHPAIHGGLRVRQEVLQPFSFRLRT